MTPALPGENVSVSGGYYMQARTPAVPGKSLSAPWGGGVNLFGNFFFIEMPIHAWEQRPGTTETHLASDGVFMRTGACLIRVYLCPSMVSALLRASAVWDWGDSVRQAPLAPCRAPR